MADFGALIIPRSTEGGILDANTQSSTRVALLEDLARRNEATIQALVQRLKDIEGATQYYNQTIHQCQTSVSTGANAIREVWSRISTIEDAIADRLDHPSDGGSAAMQSFAAAAVSTAVAPINSEVESMKRQLRDAVRAIGQTFDQTSEFDARIGQLEDAVGVADDDDYGPHARGGAHSLNSIDRRVRSVEDELRQSVKEVMEKVRYATGSEAAKRENRVRDLEERVMGMISDVERRLSTEVAAERDRTRERESDDMRRREKERVDLATAIEMAAKIGSQARENVAALEVVVKGEIKGRVASTEKVEDRIERLERNAAVALMKGAVSVGGAAAPAGFDASGSGSPPGGVSLPVKRAIESAVAPLRGEVERLSEAAERAKAGVVRVENAVGGVVGRVTAVEKSIERVTGGSGGSGVWEQLEELRSSVVAVKGKVMKEAVGMVDEAVESLRKEAATAAESVVAVRRETTRAREKEREYLESLIDQRVRTLEKEVRKLSNEGSPRAGGGGGNPAAVQRISERLSSLETELVGIDTKLKNVGDVAAVGDVASAAAATANAARTAADALGKRLMEVEEELNTRIQDVSRKVKGVAVEAEKARSDADRATRAATRAAASAAGSPLISASPQTDGDGGGGMAVLAMAERVGSVEARCGLLQTAVDEIVGDVVRTKEQSRGVGRALGTLEERVAGIAARIDAFGSAHSGAGKDSSWLANEVRGVESLVEDVRGEVERVRSDVEGVRGTASSAMVHIDAIWDWIRGPGNVAAGAPVASRNAWATNRSAGGAGGVGGNAAVGLETPVGDGGMHRLAQSGVSGGGLESVGGISPVTTASRQGGGGRGEAGAHARAPPGLDGSGFALDESAVLDPVSLPSPAATPTYVAAPAAERPRRSDSQKSARDSGAARSVPGAAPSTAGGPAVGRYTAAPSSVSGSDYGAAESPTALGGSAAEPSATLDPSSATLDPSAGSTAVEEASHAKTTEEDEGSAPRDGSPRRSASGYSSSARSGRQSVGRSSAPRSVENAAARQSSNVGRKTSVATNEYDDSAEASTTNRSHASAGQNAVEVGDGEAVRERSASGSGRHQRSGRGSAGGSVGQSASAAGSAVASPEKFGSRRSSVTRPPPLSDVFSHTPVATGGVEGERLADKADVASATGSASERKAVSHGLRAGSRASSAGRGYGDGESVFAGGTPGMGLGGDEPEATDPSVTAADQELAAWEDTKRDSTG